MGSNMVRAFAPCVEAQNETAFLTKNPIDIIRSGYYNMVPMIIGYNSNEGLISLLPEFSSFKGETEDIPYGQYIPHQMNLSPEDLLCKEICEKLEKQYSASRPGERFLVTIQTLHFLIQ